LATLKDIANQTGVSVNTVSLALRNSPRIKEDTRKRILSAAAALDYTPNHAAQSLVNKRNMTVGLLLTDMTSPVLTQVAQAVEFGLKAKGYVTLLAASNGDQEEEARALATFRARQVDGVLVYPNHRQDLGEIRRLDAAGMPVVLLAGKEIDGLNVVTIDEQLGSRRAAEHLLAQGHRRIGILDSDRVTGNSEKLDGYRAALAAAGVAVDEGLISAPGGHSIAHGYKALGRLMKRGAPPSAVLASTDRIAMGALRWCAENGIDVPGQMSIVGYDNVEYAAAASTPLSSVNYPAQDVAESAVSLILQLIEESAVGPEAGPGAGPAAAPRKIVLDPELVLRESTGPLRGD